MSITGDVWIGYLYAKVPFLLLGCARLQSVNGVNVSKLSDCFTICKGGTFGIQRTSHAPSGLLCICVTGSLDTSESSCIGGDKTSLCNNCFVIYTQINVNASQVSGPNDNPGDDCLTYYYPHFAWQPCSGVSFMKSMCSNATYQDLAATATATDLANNEWVAGNKLCLTTGQHPSFVQSIGKTGFADALKQYYWTGIFRDNILIKRSMKDVFSRFSNDGYVYVHKWNKILHSSNPDETKRALCVKGAESTTRHPETSNHTTEIIPSITQSTYADTSAILTIVTTPGVTISLPTTEKHTSIATDNAFPTSNGGITEKSGRPHSEKSPAISIGIGVSVSILLLVGGAVVIFLNKRRRVLPCWKIKTAENQSSRRFNDCQDPNYEAMVERNEINESYCALGRNVVSGERIVSYINSQNNKNNLNSTDAKYSPEYYNTDSYEYVQRAHTKSDLNNK
ncbi:hypothetical protein DPMN_128124 [Dreissena polymorpha]|uniref:Uncharacterized protein n=1 Tax=Dreissena polymorpha TaxID=45954 RepID=A0A9D4H2H7_DREPO|nr:hypothetical protein DPMN_128124 [Dreissena polymorpha]